MLKFSSGNYMTEFWKIIEALVTGILGTVLLKQYQATAVIRERLDLHEASISKLQDHEANPKIHRNDDFANLIDTMNRTIASLHKSNEEAHGKIEGKIDGQQKLLNEFLIRAAQLGIGQ